VLVWFTLVVGVLKAKPTLPDAEPCGVKKAALSHVAVAVLVPLLEPGAEA
jgi:hypothetical protein